MVSLIVGIIIYVLHAPFALCDQSDINSISVLNNRPTKNYQYLLKQSNGKKIFLSSNKDMPSQIDNIQTESIVFHARIDDSGCGKGYFLFDNIDNYKYFNSFEKYLLYSQYIEKQIEPTALNLVQDENHFYLNLSSEKLIDKYCQFNVKGRTILIKALLVKVYSNNEQFNYLTITNIHFQ
ncbi:hypothetical protein [uncultured Gilliamella sp.]|uniref:hypothetical protein n=1 Tax=uncultured Gilliamella sp. TaxID=1193505 RepID=UPI0025E0726D|nr:hypothetical protein [uncultured Gilliamella sp.]